MATLVVTATCAILLAIAAPRASAQAPVITPAGDPTVNADSLYKLAIDPSAAGEDNYLYLFDDAVIRFESDGRSSRTYRQIVQVLKQPAVAMFAERGFVYQGERERFVINWVRVLRRPGEVVSEKPAQVQESDIPAAIANPVYRSAKSVRISLAGVAVGAIIDVSYTIEETKPSRVGDALTAWRVNPPSVRVRRSRFVLDAPSDVKPVVSSINLDFSPRSGTADGRRTTTWERADPPKFTPEPFAPDTNSVQMHIIASLPGSWGDVARWYGTLGRDRYGVTPALEAKLAELVAPARTKADSIRAIHRWVAQDIRYVSIALGMGGYQPRTADTTFTTGFGDCKDKATLFIALLRRMGVTAYPVLLHTNASNVQRAHPSIRQFNHAIAAVEIGKNLVYTDLTSAYTPFGELPWPEQGGFALVVLPDGNSREVALPKAPHLSRSIEVRVTAVMSDSGFMTGVFEEVNRGIGFEARRAAFAQPLDSARKATIMRGLLGILPGAQGDSIIAFDGRDLTATPDYRIVFSRAKGVTMTGGLALFTFPWGVLPGAARVAALNRLGPRKTSIDAAAVLRSPPPTRMLVTMHVTLPDGWQARVPASVVVSGEFGVYSTEYRQDGRVLTIARREESGQGIFPPSRLPDIVSFFKAISADEENRTLVIDRPAR